jgi:hypothetical protein
MAYDVARGRLVLFGGKGSTGSLLNSTWEFDGAQWLHVLPVGPAPTARYGHAMVYDSASHVIVMFGGQTSASGLNSGLSAQTFQYDGTSWTEVANGFPTARLGHAMAYDSARERVVLYGGQTATGLSGGTFEFDGDFWQNANVVGPSARQGHVMAYDSWRQVTVIHGGTTTSTDDSSTWEWNGVVWAHVTNAGMTARSDHCMAFDALRGVMVAFGGVHGQSYLDTVWEYDGAGWSQHALATGPIARSGSCMAFDPVAGGIVMAGGVTSTNVTGEVWELVPGAGAAPQITQQPAPVSANLGDTVTFHGQASGATAWQWRRDGVVLVNGGRIGGATSSSLMISGVTGQDWGDYRVDPSNNCGTTASTPASLSPASHCGSADFNCDGDVGTDADIESFFACLAGNCPGSPCTANADFNGDGDVGTDADIESFFRVLAGGTC